MDCPNGCEPKMSKTKQDKAFLAPSGDFFVVKDLPVYQCDVCGEIVVPAESSEKIDQILDGKQGPSDSMNVPVYRVKSA